MTIRELIDKYGNASYTAEVKIGTEEKVRGDGMMTIYEGLLAEVPDWMLIRKVTHCSTTLTESGVPKYIDVE